MSRFRKISHAEALANAQPVTATADANPLPPDQQASTKQIEYFLHQCKKFWSYTLDRPSYTLPERADMLLRHVVGRPLPAVSIYAIGKFVTKYEVSKAIAVYTALEEAWEAATPEMKKIVWGFYHE